MSDVELVEWFERTLKSRRREYHAITVSPVLAKKMLEKNLVNRPVRKHHVAYLAQQMAGGLFLDCPQPIAFDVSGDLIDGQHRLLAIEQSGVSVPIRVCFGEAHRAREVIDQGVKRQSSDILSMHKIPNACAASAAINLELNIASGALHKRVAPISAVQLVQDYQSPMFEHLPTAIKFFSRVRSAFLSRKINCGITVGMLRILREYTDEECVPFVEKFATGIGLADGDPIAALRNRFIKGGLNPFESAALVIKAWNFSLQGKRIQNLIWKECECFPEVDLGGATKSPKGAA